MMALDFLVLLLAGILACAGIRSVALVLFTFSMIFALVWFLHHVTTHLALQF